jgi:hypothetical protein
VSSSLPSLIIIISLIEVIVETAANKWLSVSFIKFPELKAGITIL